MGSKASIRFVYNKQIWFNVFNVKEKLQLKWIQLIQTIDYQGITYEGPRTFHS